MIERILAASAACLAVASGQAAPIFTEITPPRDTVTKVVVHPLEPRRVLVATEGGMRVSADGGNRWSEAAGPGGPIDRLFALRGRPGVVFAQRQGFMVSSFCCGTSGRGGDTYRSDDFGLSWTLVNQGESIRRLRDEPGGPYPTAVSPFSADPLAPEHVYAATRTPYHDGPSWLDFDPYDRSVLESFDGGRTWRGAAMGLPEGDGPYGVEGVEGPVPGAPGRLFFTVSGRGAFVSHDSARTWQPLPRGADFKWIRQDPARPLVLYAWSNRGSFGPSTVLRSEDGAETWRGIYDYYDPLYLPPNRPMLTVDASRPDRLWLTGLREGVMLSENRGGSWTNLGFSTDTNDYRRITTELATSTDDIAQVYVISLGRLYRGDMAPRTRVAIEYRYGDSYWITGDRGEALSQDYRGSEAVRTGARFGLWGPLDAPAGAQPICRFQGRPAFGQGSRFIAVAGAECDWVKTLPAFSLEAEGEYFAVAPGASGDCTAGTVPVRRFYNQQPSVNHRYTVDPAIAAEMRTRGWQDNGVTFCARALGENE